MKGLDVVIYFKGLKLAWLPLMIRTITLLALLLVIGASSAAPLFAAESVVLRVSGIDGDPLKNVEAALTLPPALVKDGRVDKPWLDHFCRQIETRVKEAIEPFGYNSSTVTSVQEKGEMGNYLIRVTIQPGPVTRLSEIRVGIEGDGRQDKPLKEISAAFPLQKGDILLHERYENAKRNLLARAREQGYLDADFSVHEITLNPGKSSAAINLTLQTGSRYYFGETAIQGATYYPENLLRRYISFSPGEPFSYKKLGETQLNFSSSAYFKSVSVIPEKQSATELKVPVTVQVVPLPRRTLRPGIGYGTDTGMRGTLNYKDLSLFSPGHILHSDLTVAEKLKGAAVAYSIPSQLNLQTMTTLQLNLQREDINDSTSRMMALELDRTSGYGNNLLGTVFVRFQFEQYTLGLEDATSRLLLPGLRLAWNNYDNLIRPAHGIHCQLETRGTHPLLGSDTGFIQFIAEGGAIASLPWRMTVKTRGKAGTSILNDPFADLPTSLRYFAGGENSVRGYAYKSLGPEDASGEVVGGRNLLQGSFEVERSLFKEWGVSLFYDAGNAFDSFSDYQIHQGAGIGVNYHSPIGSINLYLARQVGISDPAFRIHFSIGLQL